MTCTPEAHIVRLAPCGTFEFCDCNAIRTQQFEPLSYSETKDYIAMQIKEGLYRGVNCAEILKAVVKAVPLDDMDEYDKYIDANHGEEIDFYKKDWPNFHVCARCHVVTQKDKMVCTECADGKRPYANLEASK